MRHPNTEQLCVNVNDECRLSFAHDRYDSLTRTWPFDPPTSNAVPSGFSDMVVKPSSSTAWQLNCSAMINLPWTKFLFGKQKRYLMHHRPVINIPQPHTPIRMTRQQRNFLPSMWGPLPLIQEQNLHKAWWRMSNSFFFFANRTGLLLKTHFFNRFLLFAPQIQKWFPHGQPNMPRLQIPNNNRAVHTTCR